MENNEIWDLFFENIKKVIFPEEWLDLDLALSKQDIFALMLLERKGEIIMSEIANYINVPMSTATGIVDRLIKNGYLERNRSETDRRVVLIKLTEKGKSISTEIKNLVFRYIRLISEALTDEERAFLFRIASKIIAIINKNADSDKNTGEEVHLRKISIE